MRLVQEEGQDAGVQSVSDHDSANAHQSNGVSKVLHVVKISVQFILDFILEMRSNGTLCTFIEENLENEVLEVELE